MSLYRHWISGVRRGVNGQKHVPPTRFMLARRSLAEHVTGWVNLLDQDVLATMRQQRANCM
jgi:hypothetical protein